MAEKHLKTLTEVLEVAHKVFPEERVDGTGNTNNNDFSIRVYFPVLTLTNSKNEEHTIKGMYVRIIVEIYADGSVNTRLGGRRDTFTLKEWKSRYTHSHLPGSTEASEGVFCLGSSAFALLLAELSVSPTSTNWEMIFLSLESYLKWESLEGGPYLSMSNIGYSPTIDEAQIVEVIKTNIHNFPTSIWDVGSGGSVSICTFHPDLIKYMDGHFPLRSFSDVTKEQMEEEVKMINNDIKRKSFTWKGKIVTPKVVTDDDAEEIAIRSHVGREIIESVEKTLLTNFTKYIKKINYEEQKEKAREKVFGSWEAIREEGTDPCKQLAETGTI